MGGTRVYLGALIRALGELKDGPERYLILSERANAEWLIPLLGSNQELVYLPATSKFTCANLVRKLLIFISKHSRSEISSGVYNFVHEDSVSVSNGYFESLNLSVLHFPYQLYIITNIPTVYNPHDLQHLHLPQFFSTREIFVRYKLHPLACNLASRVVVASNWIANDVAEACHVIRKKIAVIRWGAASSGAVPATAMSVDRIRTKYKLPTKFIFYPAMTWPHKNHLRLFEAVEILISRGQEINLILSGFDEQRGQHLRDYVAQRMLSAHVAFLGLLPDEDMRSLYKAASLVVVPTLFEAASGPVYEAWQEEVPAACSNLPQLIEQCDDAVAYFDPHDSKSIAEVISGVLTDTQTADRLVAAGKRRLAEISWSKTAREYREVYREVVSTSLGIISKDNS